MLGSLSGLAAAVLLVLALRVRSVVGGLAIDQWFTDALVPRAPSGAFTDRTEYRRIASVGSRTSLTCYVVAVSGYLLARGRVRGAVVAGAGPLVAVLLAELVLKPAVDRTTELSGAWSFPSGTATAAAAMCTSACLLAYRVRPVWAALAVVLSTGVVVVVDAAVVALSWHYATDVIAGNALGVGVVTTFAAIGSKHRPDAASAPTRPD